MRDIPLLLDTTVIEEVRLNRYTLGCGRFFEGNAEEMHTALNKTLSSLPDDTKVYVS